MTKWIERGSDRRLSSQGSPDGAERRMTTSDRRHENNRQYATFLLEDHLLGIEVENVQEILSVQGMTNVPLAPAMIAGLINLRGEIVTALDLRIRLGFPERPVDLQPMNLIVRTPDGLVDLLVDQIGDVIELLPDLFEPPPETLDRRLLEVTDGIYKLKEQLLLALNTERVTHILGSAV